MVRLKLIVYLVAIALAIVGCSGGIPEEFRSDALSFMDEGERLSVMTSQGLSFLEFRAQLVEVKSAHARLEGRWPRSLVNYDSRFQHAIDGWDLALRTWEYHIDVHPIIGAGETLNPQIAAYLDADMEVVRFEMTDKLILYLLAKASDSFESASDDLVIELQ